MKLGLMQPYFFPYLGYFSLIKNTDCFIFFDTPQYERRGWMNRNRIINANGEVAYISVPLNKAPQQTAIKDMTIDNSQKWGESMLGKLVYYKKNAPYYEKVSNFFSSLITPQTDSLADLNISTTIAVAQYLGIDTKFETLSKMNLMIGEINAPDEWALEITKALGYETYVNPPGGMSFYDKNKYLDHNITLEFLQADLRPYDQKLDHFEPGLSILDVMMFNAPEEIREMLDEYTII